MVPLVEWDASVYVTTGSTCCVALRFQWENDFSEWVYARMMSTCVWSPSRSGTSRRMWRLGRSDGLLFVSSGSTPNYSVGSTQGVDVCLRPLAERDALACVTTGSMCWVTLRLQWEHAELQRWVADACLGPLAEWDASACVTNGLTCCVSPRLKWGQRRIAAMAATC